MMLELPSRGINRSIRVHNVKLDVFCDWIEGSVLFKDGEVSSTDVVDALIEEQIYDNQDFASEMANNAWTELRRRLYCIGNQAPFFISANRITRIREWQDAPAYSFCILLALANWYKRWAIQFGSDYTEQGEIFELLTKESLKLQFSGWQIYQTGWTRTKAVKLAEVVDEIANQLGECKGNIERWASLNANEAGLDLLCYRPFIDNRVGIPVYLTQCASGADWRDKLKTPDLDLWTKIIQFTAQPQRAFATPFAFLDEDFIKNCVIVNGMLLDRYRLLAAAKLAKNWESQLLKERIVMWAGSRVSKLPGYDN